MEEEKKKKLLKLYAKSSKPEEMFFDLFEKIEKVNKQLEEVCNYLDSQSEPKDGKDGEDGHTPSSEELQEMIKPLIPKVENGKDGRHGKNGSSDTAEDIKNKIISLKGKDRLSILDLKDLEWLNNYRDWLNTNIIGAQANTSSSLGFTYINEIVSGSGTSFILAHTPINSNNVVVFGGGSRLTIGADFTISGKNITTTNAYSAGQVVADYS